jgi:hypothetical protein
MTDAKRHDVRVAKSEEKLDFHLLPDSIISVDRAYVDFEWLYSLEKRAIWFVTRAKRTRSTELPDCINRSETTGSRGMTRSS